MSNPYATLKATFIKRMAPSEHRCFQQLTAEDLGDQGLTQLLHHMQQFLSDRHAAFAKPLFCELFLQCLPPHIRMRLAANAEQALLDTANLADHLIDTVISTVANDCGYNNSGYNTSRCRLHSLRHTFCLYGVTTQTEYKGSMSLVIHCVIISKMFAFKMQSVSRRAEVRRR